MVQIILNSALLIVATVALILLNGVFVAAEFAIVRVRRTRLEELAGQGTEAAKDAILLIDAVSEYLAVTQIGMTVASLGVGWLGEDAFARLFLVFVSERHLSHTWIHIAAGIAAFLLITVMHVVLGELVPKNLAIDRGEQFVLVLARPLRLLHFALRPAMRLLHALSVCILYCLGHREIAATPLTEDELKLVMMQSHKEGVISEGEAKIIMRAFEFADKEAQEIMIPAEHVAFLSMEREFEQNLEVARRHLHARLPLCRTGLNSILGVVSMKDAWPLIQHEASNAAFERVCRPPIRVSPETSQENVLKLLQKGHGQMGIVRDQEDLRTLGIVTLEDVLESLVGDVREAHLCPEWT
jgi:CBS domain containing-hemolysin-like protein